MTGNVPFVIIGEDYGMSRNMGYVIILLTVILSAGLMGVNKTRQWKPFLTSYLHILKKQKNKRKEEV